MADPSLRLPAMTITALIEELSGLQERFLAGAQLEIPIVTLLLDSGHSLSGMVVRMTRSSHPASIETDPTLLIQHQDKLTMSYVRIVAIRGITIQYSESNLHLLSAGKIKPSSGKVISRLNLERYARSLTDTIDGTIVTIAWDEIPRSDAAFWSLNQLLQDLAAVAIGIRSDELGRTSFQERVERIEVRVGTNPAVRLDDRVLTIYARIEAQELILLDKRELQQAIESSI